MGIEVRRSPKLNTFLLIDTVTQDQGEVLGTILVDPATGEAATTSTTGFIDTVYACLHNFTGATVGDLIVQSDQYDLTTSPATLVATVWRNATLGTVLGSAPLATNLTYMGGAGLTDAQLRATPVPVLDAAIVALLPASLGPKPSVDSFPVVWSDDNNNTLNQILDAVEGQTPYHSSAGGNHLVHNGAATLGKVIVNAKGTVASAMHIYNGTDATGTLLAVIDTLNLSGTFDYNIACSTGIFIVTTGTIAPDFTATYR